MRPWKSFEHRVVHALRDMGFEARRTTSGRQGQEETADVEAEKDGVKLLVECKFTSRAQYATSRPIKLEWLRKLEERARKTGRIPVLIFNYPGRGYYAVIPLRDLGKVARPAEKIKSQLQ
ncbi:MAG: restriction endonuclease [Deltaproteobacteria bacterium]|nr:restriction endonuclease [Deltaproteobacteria bacterium]